MLDIENADDVMMVNSGGLCEQFVGQHLLYLNEYYKKPELYYWVREAKSSSAKVLIYLFESTLFLIDFISFSMLFLKCKYCTFLSKKETFIMPILSVKEAAKIKLPSPVSQEYWENSEWTHEHINEISAKYSNQWVIIYKKK